MDPIVKQILNNLKCPVCQGQVDILSWKGQAGQPNYNYCCVSDWVHYRLLMNDYIVRYETVIIYEGNHKYEIEQFVQDTTSRHQRRHTSIYIYDVDAENRDTSSRKEAFAIGKSLFDFSQTNREKIVNRVKTILVFQ